MSRYFFQSMPLPALLVAATAFMILTPSGCIRNSANTEEASVIVLDDTAQMVSHHNLRSRSFTNSNSSQRPDTTCGNLLLGQDETFPLLHTSKKNCQSCTSIPQCKWCPLTQTCAKEGSKPCPKRKFGAVYDAKVKGEYQKGMDSAEPHSCDMPYSSSWRHWMDEVYGKAWEREKERYMDVIRCSQWALGWPIDADDNMQIESGKVGEDDVGRWACRSALLRAGIDWMLREEGSHDNPKMDPWKQGLPEPEPQICELIRLKVKSCQVDIFGLQDFRALRKVEQSRNDKSLDGCSLMKSIQAGPVVAFDPGAGKSGSGFARTWDSRFFLKTGLKDGSAGAKFMDEPNNLKKMVRGTGANATTSLIGHLEAHKDSLLNRYSGLLSYRLGSGPVYVLIMQDATYGMDAHVQQMKQTQSNLEFIRYDLKGESRDPNRVQDPDKQFTLINGEFKKNEHERMKLNPSQCRRFHQALQADLDFLGAHDMIDYSIFLTVAKALGSASPPSCSQTLGEPFCIQEGSYTYTISLIDYTNDYTKTKWVTDGGWRGKFADYNKQIMDFSLKICPEKQEGMPKVIIFCGVAGALTLIAICLSVWYFCVTSRKDPEPVPPAASYGGPQPPAPSYGGPQAPASSYAGAQSPAPSYGGPQAPASSYAGAQSPAPSYGGPQAPASSYGGSQQAIFGGPQQPPSSVPGGYHWGVAFPLSQQ